MSEFGAVAQPKRRAGRAMRCVAIVGMVAVSVAGCGKKDQPPAKQANTASAPVASVAPPPAEPDKPDLAAVGQACSDIASQTRFFQAAGFSLNLMPPNNTLQYDSVEISGTSVDGNTALVSATCNVSYAGTQVPCTVNGDFGAHSGGFANWMNAMKEDHTLCTPGRRFAFTTTITLRKWDTGWRLQTYQ